MDLSYYLFAFYVFVLAAIIVVLFKKVRGAEAKSDNGINKKEQKLFKQYQNLEEMIVESQQFIEESVQEIKEQKEKIDLMLERAEKTFAKPQAQAKTVDITVTDEIEPKSIKEDIPAAPKEKAQKKSAAKKLFPNVPPDKLTKNQKVKILVSEGKDTEQISNELGISKSEVSMIIGLDR